MKKNPAVERCPLSIINKDVSMKSYKRLSGFPEDNKNKKPGIRKDKRNEKRPNETDAYIFKANEPLLYENREMIG